MNDLRFALRMCVKSPGFTAVATLVLAVGIAGMITVFSLFNGLFLRPFPAPHQERLVDLSETDPGAGGARRDLWYPHFNAWRQHNRTFECMATCSFWGANLTTGRHAERVGVILATHGYFELLGIRPVLGRPFSAEEDRPGGPNVLLLSYRIWERLFGRDPALVGQTVRLDDDAFTVLGVLPPEAEFPVGREVWRPLCADPVKGHGGLGGLALGRLKKGVTVQQAREDLARVQGGWAEQHPEEKPTVPIVTGFRERYLSEFEFGLAVLLGVVGFVQLIACNNVASLLLARGVSRTREIALRLALGATRGRVVQQLLSESLILAIFGSIGGTILGYWGLQAIVVSLSNVIPAWMHFGLDIRFAGFAVLLTIVVTGLSGLLPALQAARHTDWHGSLQALGASTTSSRDRLRMLNATVVGQIALALTLLVGTGLLLRTLFNVQRVDPGFHMEGLLTYQIPLPIGPYFDEQKRRAFFDQHLANVRALPGVESATLCNSLPFSYLNAAPFEVEALRGSDASGSDCAATKCSVMPGYFETMSITLLQGRPLTAWDNRPDSERCVVVDRTFAERFWSGGDALGKRIRSKGEEPWMRIVGVAQAVRNIGLDQGFSPTVYVPYVWEPSFVTSGVIRTSRDPQLLVAAIRAGVRSQDPALPVTEVQTMSGCVRQSLWGRRILAWLAGVPAVAAAIMAAAGLCGVISYSVHQRTREFGIRLAVGAQRAEVVWLVVGQALRLVTVGIGLGLCGSLALTQVLRSLLFQVGATDPTTYVLVSFLLACVALLASYLPACRAANVDPIRVLRSE
jgi:putative ABC transport system permease protein